MSEPRDLSDEIGRIPRTRPEDAAAVRRLAATQPDAALLLAILGLDEGARP